MGLCRTKFECEMIDEKCGMRNAECGIGAKPSIALRHSEFRIPNSELNKTLTVIAGPTASGKTAFAIELAKALGTVIISADSRQFYKEMSIGTAAPTPEELLQVKHYFIHNISIEDKYDVADYEREVLALLDELFKTHDNVILTGGSGLFIDAVCNGIDEMPDVQPEIRLKVEKMLKEGGINALADEVQRLDPEYFAIVDQQNPRRLQRALEICYQTGKTFSSFRQDNKAQRDFNIVKYALLWDRQELIKRIDRRVELMMEQGLLEEAKALCPKRELNALNTVGYKELFSYFDNRCTLAEAVEQIKIHTRQYAKRQMTWLRRDTSYQWIMPEDFDSILSILRKGFE